MPLLPLSKIWFVEYGVGVAQEHTERARQSVEVPAIEEIKNPKKLAMAAAVQAAVLISVSTRF